MSKKKNTKNTRFPKRASTKIAKTFAEALSNVRFSYDLSSALSILHANSFLDSMGRKALLKYLEECGLVQEDTKPTALALEKGVLVDEPVLYEFEDGTIIPGCKSCLTGYGLLVIVASLIAARKEEQA